MWNEVQAEIERRGGMVCEGKRYSKRNWFSGKITCGKCGGTYNVGTNPRKEKRTTKCTNRLRNGSVPRINDKGKQVGCDAKCVNELALVEFMRFVLEHIQTSHDEIVKDMLDEIHIMQQNDEIVDTKPLENNVEDILLKKRRAYDLMLGDKINQDDLVEQVAFYDSEIARLTEEINQAQNMTAFHQMQIDKIKSHIDEVNKAAQTRIDSDDIYGELLERFVVFDGNAEVYLKCMPIGFRLFYHTTGRNPQRKFEVFIDSYEVVE
jgi:predicted small metal-binding protein